MGELAKSSLLYFVRWTLYAIATGLLVGFIGTLFRKSVDFGTANWNAHPQFLLPAPLSVTLIVGLEKLLHEEKNGGINTVIDPITKGKHITVQTAPLIFLSTVFSHLIDASVGREDAALMIGGSLGEALSKAFRMDEKDKRIAIMCGMSACFTTIFGMPPVAAIFPMEMISIGIMYHTALILCLFAVSITAHVLVRFGIYGEAFPVMEVPAFNLHGAVMVISSAVFCAVLAMALSILLYRGHRYTVERFPNPRMCSVVGAAALLCLTALNQQFLMRALDFNGGGFMLIEKTYRGETVWYSFLFRMISTCTCLFGSFKGGEIVPTLIIGACFGAVFVGWFGLPVLLYTGIGVAVLFASMTNSPFTSLLMTFEIFGFAGIPYYVFVIVVCFTLSDYYGLYMNRKFPYSKTQAIFINRKGPRKLWNIPEGTAETKEQMEPGVSRKNT